MAGDASTSLPLKVGNAGNGYSTLALPPIRATGNGVVLGEEEYSRKGESLMLGSWESNGFS